MKNPYSTFWYDEFEYEMCVMNFSQYRLNYYPFSPILFIKKMTVINIIPLLRKMITIVIISILLRMMIIPIHYMTKIGHRLNSMIL